MLYPLSHRREVGMGLKGVIDGFRTRDNRSHNPMLYQLSYDHQKPSFGAYAPHGGARRIQ